MSVGNKYANRHSGAGLEEARPEPTAPIPGTGVASRAGGAAKPTAEEQARLEIARQADFLALLKPLYPKALAYAQTITGSLMDGEDLTGDSVLSAYARFDSLRDRARFKEWFFSILLNRFRNLRSRQRLHPLTLVADFGEHQSKYFWEATARVSGDPAELGYQLTLVKELLARLAPREREALLLLGPVGLTPPEAASAMRISRRALIQLAYRARQRLVKMLPEGDPLLAGLPVKGSVKYE